jgi:hypothetical protein
VLSPPVEACRSIELMARNNLEVPQVNQELCASDRTRSIDQPALAQILCSLDRAARSRFQVE